MDIGMRVLPAADAPADLLDLAARVAAALLEGDHPTAVRLRAQLAAATPRTVELSGAGAFVNYDVPPDLAPVDPPSFYGGWAFLALDGLEHGAGATICVRDGHLDFVELYVFGAEPWPERIGLKELEVLTPLARSRPVQGPRVEFD